MSTHQLKRLRRFALSAQGLLTTQPFGLGLAGARRAIEHLGYVQLDTISVVERAHHHVLFSRVPDFKPEMVDKLMQGGDIFEYWAHAAAILPIKDFRYSLPYKHAIKSGQTHWYKDPDKKLMNELLVRIRTDGPLRSRDINSQVKNSLKKKVNNQGWWDWKPAKKAIEQLYMQGDLMISERQGFQKTYDLTERVLADDVNTKMPTVNEWARHLLDQQLRCHGVVSLKGLTYLRRNKALKKAMKTLVEGQLAGGVLRLLQMPDGAEYMIKAEVFKQRLPRLKQRLVIMSPFDNGVIQRDRLKDLFDFEYQIECYVPAAKRKYGYFSLPLLWGDQFIGRMDCKAHRKERILEIKSLHFEDGEIEDETFFSSFVTAVNEFKVFQGCDEVHLGTGLPDESKTLMQLKIERLRQY